MRENITAIIQARMGATRLPGKVLFDLERKTVLERIIERVQSSRSIKEVIVATTINSEDLKIVKLCADIGVRVFCGCENDVLDRYFQAARLLNTEHVVRITADCPMIDPVVIDEVICVYLENKVDYASNILNETYPDGEDVEVFTFAALEKAWNNAILCSEREHVTPFIKKNKDMFTHTSLEYKVNLSSKRWTLDNPEDYEFIKTIYKHLYHKNNRFGMNEILEFLDKNPEVEKINSHITRNEGYLKSLRQDRNIRD